MKIINLEIENEIIKCPKCFSENIDENGVKNVCEHLIFVGTSESDEPELDKEKLISNYDIEKHETYIDFLKENLNDTYFLFTDSRTRQIDLYLIYKNI